MSQHCKWCFTFIGHPDQVAIQVPYGVNGNKQAIVCSTKCRTEFLHAFGRPSEAPSKHTQKEMQEQTDLRKIDNIRPFENRGAPRPTSNQEMLKSKEMVLARLEEFQQTKSIRQLLKSLAGPSADEIKLRFFLTTVIYNSVLWTLLPIVIFLNDLDDLFRFNTELYLAFFMMVVLGLSGFYYLFALFPKSVPERIENLKAEIEELRERG